MLAYLLLGVGQAVGLALIPLGLPGTWLQLAAVAAFGWYTEFEVVGTIPLLVLTGLALTAELSDAAVDHGQSDRRLRRRIGVAGVVGGGAGAMLGLPFPLLGSMFGGLIGAAAGALLGSFGARTERGARVPVGGTLFSTTMKAAAGIAIAAFTLLSLTR